MSQGQPARCTHIIARLRGDSMRRADSGSILLLTGSMSAKTGVAPTATMQAALAKKLREGRITSSPAPTPKARSASSSATVPLLTAMPWGMPQNAANSASKARFCSPWTMALTRPVSRTRVTAAISSGSCCGQRSAA